MNMQQWRDQQKHRAEETAIEKPAQERWRRTRGCASPRSCSSSRTIKAKSYIANALAEHKQCVVQQKQRCCIADPYHQQRENRHVIFCFLFYFSILTLVLPDSTSMSNQFNICENYFDTLEQLIQHLLKKCWNRILQMLERHVENVELLYWNVEK